MKKIIGIFALMFLVLSFASCGGGEQAPEVPEEQTCEHSYVEIERVEPRPMVDGKATLVCSVCDETKIEIIPKTKSLKVLAIGNSFSVDAVTYLYDICKSEGMTEIIIGNANIGGCSVDTHASNIVSNSPSYAYKKYSTEKGGYMTEVTLDYALKDEDWDFVTIQQVSQLSGKPDSLSNLQTVIDRVNEKCPGAEIYWHMTWAYQQDSTHSGFNNYNNDQITMYNAIVSTTKDYVLANSAFKGAIPSGTAIQNLRTSYWGDNVTRDGYHASYGLGRMTIAVTWYGFFTGGDVDDVFWYPTGEHMKEVVMNWDLIVEAAKNALNNPYEITPSERTEKPAED